MLLSEFLLAASLFAQLSPPPHPFFDTDQVHEIRLTFAQPDWYDVLRQNFEGHEDDPAYAECSFAWNGVTLDRIGIRFKGNSSYRSYPGRKKPFKLKFNKYVKGQKIEGLETVNLHNAFRDPSFVREKVFYELANAAGLATPRVNYAALYINDAYWGLYFLTEEADDEAFLESRFGDSKEGNLYKGDPRGTLEWLGSERGPYEKAYELKTNEDTNDWTDLIRLVDVLNNAPREQLAEKLEAILDVEAALRYLALLNLTVNLDSYTGSGHNYYLYHRQQDDRFTVFPWDPNEAWGVFSMNMPLDMLINLPADWPRPAGGAPGPGGAPNGGPRPLATRLLFGPYAVRYHAILRDLIAGVAAPDVLVARMNALRDLIRPRVLEDRQKMFTDQQFEDAMSRDLVPRPPAPGQPALPGGTIPGLETFVRARTEALSRQLAR